MSNIVSGEPGSAGRRAGSVRLTACLVDSARVGFVLFFFAVCRFAVRTGCVRAGVVAAGGGVTTTADGGVDTGAGGGGGAAGGGGVDCVLAGVAGSGLRVGTGSGAGVRDVVGAGSGARSCASAGAARTVPAQERTTTIDPRRSNDRPERLTTASLGATTVLVDSRLDVNQRRRGRTRVAQNQPTRKTT